jgi:UDP-N-acetylglucosamine 2-epimerase (non-hydrolysing)
MKKMNSTSKKVLLVVGTRPNFIKITQFHNAIKNSNKNIDLKIIHTGQHYDFNMSKVFFDQLKIQEPDVFLNSKGKTPASQIGNIIIELEKIFNSFTPDVAIVVGDVNSTLAAAISANKCGITVAHLESGLRSNDLEMPEEINRILTDKITDIYFVTEQSGLDNLKQEGIPDSKVHFVGNTMIDTLVHFENDIEKSDILEKLKVDTFVLMTMHRPRNVDTKDKIEVLFNVINKITETYQLILPIHPRTKNSFLKHGFWDLLEKNSNLIVTEALDYFAFQKLIKYAQFVITDSGGIQEETTFRRVPCLTLRDNTERPSTLTLGTNKLVEYNIESVSKELKLIADNKLKQGTIPPKWDGNATNRIIEILANF